MCWGARLSGCTCSSLTAEVQVVSSLFLTEQSLVQLLRGQGIQQSLSNGEDGALAAQVSTTRARWALESSSGLSGWLALHCWAEGCAREDVWSLVAPIRDGTEG